MSGELCKVIGGKSIRAREVDHYVNATELCKATGKKWNDYFRNKNTEQFLEALAPVAGIPATELIQTRQGGKPSEQGTWIHPRVVIHFAQWASAEFAAAVTGWVLELITTGKVELTPPSDTHANTVAKVKAEITAELAPLISELRALVTKPTPDAFTTIPDRCKYWGWSPVPEKIRREIRDLAFNLCWQATGERPVVCLQHSIWAGEQIMLLDRAIATVRQKYERLERESGPGLFD